MSRVAEAGLCSDVDLLVRPSLSLRLKFVKSVRVISVLQTSKVKCSSCILDCRRCSPRSRNSKAVVESMF